MKHFSLFTIMLITLMSCSKDYEHLTSAEQFIPPSATSIMVIKDIKDFGASLKNHNILSNLYIKELKRLNPLIDNLNTNSETYIAFTNTNSDYLLITHNDSLILPLDGLANHISERYSKLDITKTQIDSSVFYHRVLKDVFLATNNIELIKTIDNSSENDILKNLIKVKSLDARVTTAFKSSSKSKQLKLLFADSLLQKDKTSLSLDLDISDEDLSYNGIVRSIDTTFTFIDCFKHTIPQKINAVRCAPANTLSLISITYDDFTEFKKNLNQFQNIKVDSTASILNLTNEIAKIDNAIILHTLDADILLETIEEKELSESFKSVDIFEFGQPTFFESQLKPFLSLESANYFFVYEDFVVFSNTVGNCKSIITTVLNRNTINKNEAFKNIIKDISDQSSLFIYKNNEALSSHLDLDLNDYKANVVQFVYEDSYAHVNGVLKKYNSRVKTNSVSEAFSVNINKSLISPPQTVKNHITKAHDILVQDINHKLYLISNSGNILWEKQLQGKILGEVEQIDMFKNGRLQLAFVTPHRLYVLDRNGNEVSPFPRKFSDTITQPLSVFDYDGNKKYRLLVTQNKKLLMYNAKGQIVNGFKYVNNNFPVTSQPQHFRIGKKDYIVFKTGNKLQILNRQGKTRIDVKDNITFSKNEIYLYKNKFTSSNNSGQLIQVDSKGKISTKNLGISADHNITTTSKTLVALADNILTIKSKKVELDFGEYTAPRIFYLNDKIYVTTTDLQALKVYLYDSQGRPIPNFPVFGTAAADLQKLDKNKGLELITQSDDKTILVYKLN